MAIVTSKKSVLVTIGEHFGQTRKFACDYWWPKSGGQIENFRQPKFLEFK